MLKRLLLKILSVMTLQVRLNEDLSNKVAFLKKNDLNICVAVRKYLEFLYGEVEYNSKLQGKLKFLHYQDNYVFNQNDEVL